jgi:hypothetical protein
MRPIMIALYPLMLLHLFVGLPLLSPRELMVSRCAWLPFFLQIDGIHIDV